LKSNQEINPLFDLICPITKEPLTKKGNWLISSISGTRYPIRDGIPSFVSSDSLFEGRFTGSVVKIKYRDNFLRRIFTEISASQHRPRFFLKNLHPHKVILDLGCGGGGMGRVFTQYGEVVGLDTSLTSCFNARKIYKTVIHARAENIPFPDEYFDCLVSTDMLGHISEANKGKVWTEMHRVLKPAGFMLHAIETDSKSPLIRAIKKYPELYRQNHVIKPGHIGLELPSVALDRLGRFGFRILEVDPFHGPIPPVSVFASWLEGHFARPRWANILLPMLKVILISRITMAIWDLLVGLWEKVSSCVIPLDWHSAILVFCQKKT